MTKLLTFLILLLLTAVTHSKLAQVVSFFRHGSRYVLNSLYDGNETRYLWGQLTSVGMRQHQTLGEILRKQYIEKLGFISPIYDRNQIEVYSTAINRTVQSAISQLYGLYPAGTGQKLIVVDRQYYIPPFSNKTDDQERNYALPYGYQVIPIKFDQRIMMDDCVNQQRQVNKNIQLQLDDYQEMNLTYYPFLRRMANMFNISGNVTLSTMASLNSQLQCDRYIGRPLPKDFNDDDNKNLKHLDSWYKQFGFIGNLSKAINKDRFTKIINLFDGRIKNPNQALKWTFLSGHDLDMVPMYYDLNLSTSQCIQELYRKGQTTALNCQHYPQFASSLIFELYTEGLDHTIKIRSNGRYMNLCGQKQTQCKYEDWKKRVQSNMGTDALVAEICGLRQNLQNIPNPQPDFVEKMKWIGGTLKQKVQQHLINQQ